jgi:hypothetical protein
MFRRECFEDIGGYIPIKGGGIDWTAVTMARMKGWKTRTYTEKTCFHLRGIGTGSSGRLMTWFKQGRKDYSLGGHPVWQVCRSCYQITKKPYLIGGSLLLFGYLWAMIKNEVRPVPAELIVFHRREQMQRLKKIFSRRSVADRIGQNCVW